MVHWVCRGDVGSYTVSTLVLILLRLASTILWNECLKSIFVRVGSEVASRLVIDHYGLILGLLRNIQGKVKRCLLLFTPEAS